MTDLFSFVALSLLPASFWPRVAEGLRAGDSPAAVLDRLLAIHWRGEPDQRSALHARAHAAIDRALTQRITPVVWNDAEYPVALTTIVDPPPMLWTSTAVEPWPLVVILPPFDNAKS